MWKATRTRFLVIAHENLGLPGYGRNTAGLQGIVRRLLLMGWTEAESLTHAMDIAKYGVLST